MSPAVRTRCSSAQPAPACTPSGGAAPPLPPLALCLLTCRAHSPVLRRMSSSRPRTDGSARSAMASDKVSLFSSLLVIVGVKIDTLCRSPPHPSYVPSRHLLQPLPELDRPSAARQHHLSDAPPQLPAAPAPAVASATRALHTAASDPCATLRRPPLSSTHATARAPAHAHAPRADTTCLLPHHSAPQFMH